MSNVFLKMMSVIFIWVDLSVLRVDVDFCDERLTFSVNLVSGKYGAFNEIACAFVDRVNDIVVVSGFVLTARHCHEKVVGFDYLEFVDSNAAVNCQGSDCFQISSSEGFSEFDVRNFHVGIYLSFFKFSGLIRPLITLRSAPCDDKPLVKFSLIDIYKITVVAQATTKKYLV